jgi:hypothetical protein
LTVYLIISISENQRGVNEIRALPLHNGKHKPPRRLYGKAP